MLRSCLGRFATGVAVITFQGQDGPRGITINSFTSVSLHPPLVLVSIAHKAVAHAWLREAPYSVNILGAEQVALARCFAGGERIEVPWIKGELAPRLPGALAFLECRPWRSYEAGDHTLYLGEIAAFEHRRGDALGYVGGEFISIPELELGVEHLM
jgi:flavin reductase (DIM6/NTAB) family NADH-FMN oxidoreductase RutF